MLKLHPAKTIRTINGKYFLTLFFISHFRFGSVFFSFSSFIFVLLFLWLFFFCFLSLFCFSFVVGKHTYNTHEHTQFQNVSRQRYTKIEYILQYNTKNTDWTKNSNSNSNNETKNQLFENVWSLFSIECFKVWLLMFWISHSLEFK